MADDCFKGAVRIFTHAGLSYPTSTLRMAIPGITHKPNEKWVGLVTDKGSHSGM